MNLKDYIFSVFREISISHHRSIEFRAKIFAAMLLAKKKQTDEDYENLREIASEIYSDDSRRVGVLVSIVSEYIQKAHTYKSLNLDSLLVEIDKEIKNAPRYVKKIDFSHLRRLISDDENDALIQQRVYEYLVNEVKEYS
ncbi:hypothetical protein OFO01_02700 [Campylobacter sp. JMF_01 NE2]|uniref:hypothetical protein n=1 Tax=unclassified Campylobacter TaxID=2593542 RepID=UPI0022E9C2EA|nr:MULTISPECIES: hypothetical protein [unclassified Campylobacter]MDA3043236.1 hypothetical protein [Campylobacter sp. JMF_09 ED2]MDA3045075.1 hypothetical protein [Campylobacter sp. JMF_07 ED4]MDA3045655.1 hypothetical protein [Campylobacter sp. VBCF_06 NA8]MDA3049948.1 hypothetical protein [Campylobacter sp. JMF_15 NE4]MDA3050906.1 hypothetical protein [Campylobacter sp. JMF_02 ED1]